MFRSPRQNTLLLHKQTSGCRVVPSAARAPTVILSGPFYSNGGTGCPGACRHIGGATLGAWKLAASDGAVEDVCMWAAEIHQDIIGCICDFNAKFADTSFWQRAKGHMTIKTEVCGLI